MPDKSCDLLDGWYNLQPGKFHMGKIRTTIAPKFQNHAFNRAQFNNLAPTLIHSFASSFPSLT